MRPVDLRTGYGCNQRCRFCDQGDRRDTHGDAPAASILAAVPPGSGAVWLAGGEVTIRRDLPALLTGLRARGVRHLGLQTNGRVLSAPGAAASLRKVGLTDVTVALQAPDPALHDWLTDTPGGHAQAVLGARRAVAAGLRLHVATVMTRSAVSELPALAGLAVSLGATSHRWIACRPQGRAEADDRRLVPRYAALAEPLGRALSIEQDARVEIEVAGVPLCRLGRHRAAAGGEALRAFPAGFEESPPPRAFGDACAGCVLRPRCPGVPAAYLARWGEGELQPEPGAAPPERLVLDVDTAPLRVLRQRLVAAASHAREVCLQAADPWRLRTVGVLVRDAQKLGYPTVVVRGSLATLPGGGAGAEAEGWDDEARTWLLETLSGVGRVEAPAGPAEAAGAAWLAAHAPGVQVSQRPD